MLIKFDKIKYLEDFYNQKKKEWMKEIHLEAEVDSNEMVELSSQIYRNNCLRIVANQKQKYWALSGVQSLLKTLLRKRKQTTENRVRYTFYLWRAACL